jgi:hypothetical protein
MCKKNYELQKIASGLDRTYKTQQHNDIWRESHNMQPATLQEDPSVFHWSDARVLLRFHLIFLFTWRRSAFVLGHERLICSQNL